MGRADLRPTIGQIVCISVGIFSLHFILNQLRSSGVSARRNLTAIDVCGEEFRIYRSTAPSRGYIIGRLLYLHSDHYIVARASLYCARARARARVCLRTCMRIHRITVWCMHAHCVAAASSKLRQPARIPRSRSKQIILLQSRFSLLATDGRTR